MNGPEFVDDWVVGNNRFGKRCSDESDGPDEDGHGEVPIPPKGNIGIFAVAAKREVAEGNEEDDGKNVQTEEGPQRIEIDVVHLNCGSGDKGCEGSGCGKANLSRCGEDGCDRDDHGGDKCCGDKESGHDLDVGRGCDGGVQRGENRGGDVNHSGGKGARTRKDVGDRSRGGLIFPRLHSGAWQ